MEEFKERVWSYYRAYGRHMPWRDAPTFYSVLVSELMLQQTQVNRVIPKFQAFMERFPAIEDVATAPLSAVIEQWVGLGYNRRAKYLHQACQRVTISTQPSTINQLIALPGVGKNTAAAIMNYVYSVPTPFIETNIRTVYLNHFFDSQLSITDSQLLEKVTETIDTEHPREWFWALMDYGAYLKGRGMGMLKASRHYKKQSPLEGSVRQMRGWIVLELVTGSVSAVQIEAKLGNDRRYQAALDGLMRDGLVEQAEGKLHLTK